MLTFIVRTYQLSEFISFIAKFLIFAEYKYNAILKYTQTHIAFTLMAALACLLFFPHDSYSANDGKLGLKTVCIDAGHGGKDPGCISKDKKTYESRVALDVAKRLSEKIKAAYQDKVINESHRYVNYKDVNDVINGIIKPPK